MTFAGMPYCARSACRAAGSSSSFGLMVSVADPLELLTSLNAAVRIVPGAAAPPSTPVRPRVSALEGVPENTSDRRDRWRTDDRSGSLLLVRTKLSGQRSSVISHGRIHAAAAVTQMLLSLTLDPLAMCFPGGLLADSEGRANLRP